MRIAAHAAADLYTRKSAIAAYCSALTRLGLGREADIDSAEKISWNELVTSGPGCIRLRPKDTNSSRIVQVISDQSFTMAFDSVVLAQGINISVSARSFDGSLFDLSTPEADAESIPGPAGSLTVDVRNAQDSYLPAFVSVGMESTNSLNPEPDNETNLSRVDGLFSFLIAGEIRRIRNGRESL
jgi:hypothetical protein